VIIVVVVVMPSSRLRVVVSMQRCMRFVSRRLRACCASCRRLAPVAVRRWSRSRRPRSATRCRRRECRPRWQVCACVCTRAVECFRRRARVCDCVPRRVGDALLLASASLWWANDVPMCTLLWLQSAQSPRSPTRLRASRFVERRRRRRRRLCRRRDRHRLRALDPAPVACRAAVLVALGREAWTRRHLLVPLVPLVPPHRRPSADRRRQSRCEVTASRHPRALLRTAPCRRQSVAGRCPHCRYSHPPPRVSRRDALQSVSCAALR
jgi:hypothetical protein